METFQQGRLKSRYVVPLLNSLSFGWSGRLRLPCLPEPQCQPLSLDLGSVEGFAELPAEQPGGNSLFGSPWLRVVLEDGLS